MKQKATVTHTDGKYAVVEVSRSSMCDGCHKKDCESHTCAAGALMGSEKTMTARARNAIGARPGDIVWVESADTRVLGYAALVFLMPILVCAVFYAAAEALTAVKWIPYLAAAAGFIASFAVLGIIESRKKKAEPEIEITGFASAETED